MGRARIVLKVSEEFFSLCLALLRPKLANSVLTSKYCVQFSFAILGSLVRRLMAARSSDLDHCLKCLQILDFPTCTIEVQGSISQEYRLKRYVAMGMSRASAKPCQFMAFVFHRTCRWVAEGFGT